MRDRPRCVTGLGVLFTADGSPQDVATSEDLAKQVLQKSDDVVCHAAILLALACAWSSPLGGRPTQPARAP